MADIHESPARNAASTPTTIHGSSSKPVMNTNFLANSTGSGPAWLTRHFTTSCEVVVSKTEHKTSAIELSSLMDFNPPFHRQSLSIPNSNYKKSAVTRTMDRE